MYLYMSFPGGSVVKNPSVNIGDADSIPGLGRSPGEGNGNPLQYSCLGNPMDRGVDEVAELDMTKHTYIHTYIMFIQVKNSM